MKRNMLIAIGIILFLVYTINFRQHLLIRKLQTDIRILYEHVDTLYGPDVRVIRRK